MLRRSRTETIDVYFDVAATGGRLDRALQAIAAGKHIYMEKPIAGSVEEAMTIVRAAQAAGVKAAAVQDKVYLPGFQKLREVLDSGFFGRILSARLDAGWWVFDGDLYPMQRSSWNYRKTGWRRAGARHVSALALPAGEPARPDQEPSRAAG